MKKEISTCVEIILELLKTNATSEHICLQNKGITTNESKLIANALIKNNTLLSLNLSWNFIGYLAIESFKDALVLNTTLIELDLGCGNLIWSKRITVLDIYLKRNRMMRKNITLSCIYFYLCIIKLYKGRLDKNVSKMLMKSLWNTKSQKCWNKESFYY